MSTRQQERIYTVVPSVSPAVDQQQLMRACGGDAALARQVLEQMKSIVASQVDEIAQLARQDQLGAISEIAHSLKGAAAVVGAERLRLAASAIELAADSGDKAGVSEAIHGIRAVARVFVEFDPTIIDALTEFDLCRKCE